MSIPTTEKAPSGKWRLNRTTGKVEKITDGVFFMRRKSDGRLYRGPMRWIRSWKLAACMTISEWCHHVESDMLPADLKNDCDFVTLAEAERKKE